MATRTASIIKTFGISGFTLRQVTTRTGTGRIRVSLTLPRGKAGTLATRASSTTGTIVVESGHGLTTSDKVDIYNAAGQCLAYTATISAVVGNLITISSSNANDAGIPNTLGMDLIVSKQVAAALGTEYEIFAPANIKALALGLRANGNVTTDGVACVHWGAVDEQTGTEFINVSSVEEQIHDVEGGDENNSDFDSTFILDNEFTGCTEIRASNPFRVTTCILTLGCIFDLDT